MLPSTKTLLLPIFTQSIISQNQLVANEILTFMEKKIPQFLFQYYRKWGKNGILIKSSIVGCSINLAEI